MRRLIVFILLFLSANAFALNIPTFYDPQKPIIVTAKQTTITIQLPENPTTGYRWFIKNYPQNWLMLQHYAYLVPTAQRPGASGIANWTFTVNKAAFVAPQVIKIEYIYARAWDMQDGPTERDIYILTQP